MSGLTADSWLGLAQVALLCGYYEQAHLTREWYGLAGCSPKVWVTREFPFLQDYSVVRMSLMIEKDHSLYANKR